MTDRQLTIYAKLLLRDGPPDGFLMSNRSIVDAVYGCTRQTKGHKLDDTRIPYHRGNESSYRYQNACFRQISQCARPMHPVHARAAEPPLPASLHVSVIDFDIRAAHRLRIAQAYAFDKHATMHLHCLQASQLTESLTR